MNAPNNQPGGSSVSDILTALKNNVIATNAAVTYLQGIYNNIAKQQLFAGAATTSVSTLYSASSGVASHINTINICNTAGAVATFSIYIVPSGGTASAANAIFYNNSIAANTTTTLWSGVLIIPAGGTIQASASATTVTFNIAGGNSV